MRKLLLLLCAAALPLTASAQFTFQGPFPTDTLNAGGGGMHGVAVNDAGQVYLQPFGGTTTITTPAGDRLVRQLFVYEPDGTLTEEITFLTNEDGTPGDTLGGFTFRDGAGAIAWEGKSGRGLASDKAGNIYVSQFDFIYKLDGSTNRVLAQNRLPVVRPGDSATAMSVADDGTVYVREVFAVGPILRYNSNLVLQGNAVDQTSNFSRTLLVSPDGNTLFATDYENPYTIVYERDGEFSAFDSTGVTMRGMRVESVAINPLTGNYWFSSGNATDNPVNQDPEATRRWRSHTWYAFTPESLTDENPAPIDSLSWYECEFGTPDNTETTDRNEEDLCFKDGAPLPGKPRGMAFSPDGNTAYVILFSQVNAVARFTRPSNVAVEDDGMTVGSLEQNRPNPFSGRTTIEFEIERAANVTLRVYDTVGREVALVTDGQRSAGPHAVTFDSGTLAAGVYVYMLNVDGAVQTRRMMVVR